MAETAELYLITPVVTDAELFLPVMDRFLSSARPAALRLRLAEASEADMLRSVALLRPVIELYDTALILDGLPAIAFAGQCDGVHVSASEVKETRRMLGDDLQLGALCDATRDIAMSAGEDGADYVAFRADTDQVSGILTWWRAVTELPGVAEFMDFDPDDAQSVRNLKKMQVEADFVAVSGKTVWKDPDRFLRIWNEPSGNSIL